VAAAVAAAEDEEHDLHLLRRLFRHDYNCSEEPVASWMNQDRLGWRRKPWLFSFDFILQNS
jgi:hypothetical protein